MRKRREKGRAHRILLSPSFTWREKGEDGEKVKKGKGKRGGREKRDRGLMTNCLLHLP